MVTGAHTTWCHVSEMDRAVAFYRDVLGLKPGVQSPYWSEFDLGGMKLGLHPQREGSRPPLGIEGKGWYLGLQTEDLPSLRRAVEASDGRVVGDYHDTPSGAVLTVTDPDGNPIQVIQPGSTARSLSGS